MGLGASDSVAAEDASAVRLGPVQRHTTPCTTARVGRVTSPPVSEFLLRLIQQPTHVPTNVNDSLEINLR